MDNDLMGSLAKITANQKGCKHTGILIIDYLATKGP